MRTTALLLLLTATTTTAAAQLAPVYRTAAQPPAQPRGEDNRQLMAGAEGDQDNDGVPDDRDRCPNTRPGTRVNGSDGCAVLCAPGNSLGVAEQALIDLYSQGQAQASTNLLRLCVGEGKIIVPVYLLVGTSGPAVGNNSPSSMTPATILNPLGGNFAFRVEQNSRLLQSASGLSRLSLHYEGSFRYARVASMTGSESDAISWFTGGIGLQAQAPAFDADSPEQPGIFSVQAVLHGNWSVNDAFASAIDTTFHGSLASIALMASIDIKNRVAVSLSLFHAFDSHGVKDLRGSVVKFGIDLRRS